MAGELGARILKTKWLVRFPVAIFRAGFGFLFAGRLLLLEHVGRSSGQPRYVALEVLTRPSRDEVIIASGFGRTSQWFQNLQANPHCQVSIGTRRRVPATASVLPADEAAKLLADYREAHPQVWRVLDDSMTQLRGSKDYELPLVRLKLQRTGPTT
ncbi:MAG TPA: nitroreductase family deazaflavin-dependent oxidoreductase [Trueperaceae bacterium]|nr:nitroreductase family deazaflavin-dependent oxidoreductase [Trueperaceae bacterium]